MNFTCDAITKQEEKQGGNQEYDSASFVSFSNEYAIQAYDSDGDYRRSTVNLSDDLCRKTTKQSLSLEIIRSNESRMDWAAKYFDEKFSQLHSVAYSLLMDNNLFPNATGETMNTSNGLDTGKLYIDEKLRSLYVANNTNIASISLYLNAKQRMYIVDKDAVRSTDQMLNLALEGGESANNHQTVNKIVKSTHNNFKLVRSMNRFEDHEILGGVFIEARWNMMDNVINMIHSEPNSQVLVLDAQGNIMYNPYPVQTMINQEMLDKAIHSPMEPGFIESKQGILFYQPVVSAELWIVKFIPISYVNEGASNTLSFSFIPLWFLFFSQLFFPC